MKKRDIFVFCGQSNMMGACDFPPKHNLKIESSVEFKFKNKYLGRGNSSFEKVSYRCGDFLYSDIAEAYPNGEELSRLGEDHRRILYFIGSVASEGKGFSFYSEAEHTDGPCILPYFCEFYEEYGEEPIVAHIAKGSAWATQYFNDEMCDKFNKNKPAESADIQPLQAGANEAFTAKCVDLFAEADKQFDVGKKVFLLLQGESDLANTYDEYKLKLEILREYIKSIGFDYFFCIRVGAWGNPHIINVMKAQEDFCKEHDDCFMVSREISYMPHVKKPGAVVKPEPDGWFIKEPDEKYLFCRDSFYEGHTNPHINEKGFLLAAREVADNAYRILVENKEPVLGEELLSGLI